KLSPGSAMPFGMSQRGEPVACPSNRRCPSVMMTPQLVDLAPAMPLHPAAAEDAAIEPVPPFLLDIAVPSGASGQDKHNANPQHGPPPSASWRKPGPTLQPFVLLTSGAR